MGNLYSDDKQDTELFAPFRALRRHDLETLRLVGDHQGKTVPTVGGMILFGHDRERHFPDAWIQAAGPDPAGQRFRQHDRRHRGDLPLDQVRQRSPGAFPGGPQQPRQARLMEFQGYWAPTTHASRPWAGCRCSAASCTPCRRRKTAPCAPISSSASGTTTSPSRKPSASWPPPWTGAATPNCSNTTRLRGGFICPADLHPRAQARLDGHHKPSGPVVAAATSGYRVRSPLFTMNACQRKRLRLLELALLHGSGSRKAAGGVLWFSETTHIALGAQANLLLTCLKRECCLSMASFSCA